MASGRHRPSEFPRKIMIDLFDGKLHGENPAQVHFVETVEGQAVDYDFSAGRRPDPDPARPPAARCPRRPGALGAPSADEDAHRRLLGGP